jgi:anthranilate phosphoribosyltransferase
LDNLLYNFRMIADSLKRLLTRNNLTQAEAAVLLDDLLSPDATDAQIAAVLTALSAKGETEEELAGFAQTMRARSAQVSARYDRFVDTCGTGGSGAKTFNVSTAAAFIVAACGLPVAKHGNIGVTSKTGSADVLRVLGVKVDLAAQRTAEILNEIGVCFMLAPLHHTATKRVAMVRRELGFRTIFNLLGPLTNPASPPFQVVGVSDPIGCEKVALAFSRLKTERVWVVRGEDGLDEISLTGKTIVHEASPQGVRKFELDPRDFGLAPSSLDEVRAGSPQESAAIIVAVLENRRRDAARDLVLMNAAASLYLAGQKGSLPEAVEAASDAIQSGRAAETLERLRVHSNR